MGADGWETGQAGGALQAPLAAQVRATVIHAAAARIRAAREQQQMAKIEAIHRGSKRLDEHLATWEAEIRPALEAEVKKHSDAGWPPCYVRVSGLAHLERPLNNLLAWWVTCRRW